MSDTPWSGDAEALLAQAGWVRKLARALAPDRSRADDVEQEVWAEVLERPPAHAGNLRGWFASVVRNRARQHGLRESRARRRDAQASVPDRARPTDDLVAQAELQREVVAVVLGLDEPYRTVILQRYWSGLGSPEIARRHGVAASTVRGWLMRAHAELRRRLDRRIRGGREAWSGVLLAGLRQEPVPLAAATGSASSLVAGVTVMGWKLKAAIVLVLASLGAWWAWPERAAPAGVAAPVPPQGLASVVRSDDEGPAAREGNATARPRQQERRAASSLAAPDAPLDEAPEAPAGGVLTGQVRDALTREPIAGAMIVWHRDQPGTTDAEGRYRIECVPIGASRPFYARAPGYAEEPLQVRVAQAGATTLDFELQRGVPLLVRVFDAEVGTPVVGADVHVDPRAAAFQQTDDQGQVEVRIVDGRELFLRVVTQGYMPFQWSYRVEDVGRVLAPRIPLTPLGAIEGTVRDASGAALAEVEVTVLSKRAGFGSGAMMSRQEREAHDLPGFAGPDGLARFEARTDARGAFRIAVPPGSTERWVMALLSDGRKANSNPVLVRDSRHVARADVVFAQGAALGGRVIFNEAARAGVEVRWRSVPDGSEHSAQTDATGRFDFAEAGPGAIELYVTSGRLGRYGPTPRFEFEVEPGERYERDLAWSVPLATIAGRVQSTALQPLADVRIEAFCAYPTGGGMASFEATTGPDGTYRIEVPALPRFVVAARREFVEDTRTDVEPGAQDIDFFLADLGRLAIQLVDAATGAALQPEADAFRVYWRVAGAGAYQLALTSIDHSGAAALTLPAGPVDLRVHGSELGYAPALAEAVHVPAGSDDAAGAAPVRIAVPRGLTLRLVLRESGSATGGAPRDHALYLLEDAQLPWLAARADHSGRRIPNGPLWLHDLASDNLRHKADDEGRLRLTGLAPGRYSLRAVPEDLEFEPATIELGSEPPEPIEVTWRRR